MLIATEVAASPTLLFSQHTAYIRFPDCTSDYTPLYVQVTNTTDKLQELHVFANEYDISQMLKSEVRYDNNFYVVSPHQTVWVELPVIQAHDSMPRSDLYVLQSSGGPDSLWLTVQALPDSIIITGNLDIDRAPTTSPTYTDITFHNIGSAPYPFFRLYYRGLILPPSLLNDTLFPSESRRERIQVDNQAIGRQSLDLTKNPCDHPVTERTVRVYDPRAYFSNDLIEDSLIGCKSIQFDRDVRLVIKNDLSPQTTIKSLSLVSSYGWQLLDTSWMNAKILKGDSLVVRLRREVVDHAWANIRLLTSDSAIDVAKIQSYARWTTPRFYIEIDTLRLKGGTLDAGLHQFTLFAEGNLPSFVTSVSISDSVHWEISGVEIGDTLQFKTLLHGELRFKGASAWGDYPVTLRITSTPCDTVLTRTVIMHWTGSGVDEEVATPLLVVYPLPASSLLNVEAPIGSEIMLLDLLGRELIKTKADLSSSVLDVSQLAEGSYILMTKHEGRVESRKVVIHR
jgi:hypothetical protein